MWIGYINAGHLSTDRYHYGQRENGKARSHRQRLEMTTMGTKAPAIKTFKKIKPTLYAYTMPGVDYNEGWTKQGYTEAQTVEARIAQQTHTSGIRPKIEWTEPACYDDGEPCTDHDFHAYMQANGIERRPGTELFKLDPATMHDDYLIPFKRRDITTPDAPSAVVYKLRREQDKAATKIVGWFDNAGLEFLLNAKPRYGKTLTAYDVIRRMDAKQVLIVTNRPSIANSWASDYAKFLGTESGYVFVSDTPALRDAPYVVSHSAYEKSPQRATLKCITFISLQDLKGSVYFGGKFDKLKWLADTHFDLVIGDESHEGMSTLRSEKAFRNLDYDHILYMTGTAFNQLASGDFGEENIYNWSYADEQEAKANWDDADGFNPYECLPRVELRTYRMSDMIGEKVSRGAIIDDDGDSAAYAFDLNEFFATDGYANFIHKEQVEKFIETLKTNEKYPFAPETRDELEHTLWILNRVDSVYALMNMLRRDPFFKGYKIVAAVGDGRAYDDCEDVDERAITSNFKKVTNAIAHNDKTITLSVGQLTVGVTVPEWDGVLMLANMKSPVAYIQAAFRAQNPCKKKRTVTDPETGKKTVNIYRKETAYVFDFDPARTLEIYEQFADNLTPITAGGACTDEDRQANIRRMLNFMPVIGEDEDGTMIELDAAKVLSIPRVLKGVETMRRGFMCNYLFRDLDRIFGNAGVMSILDRIEPQKQGKKRAAADEKKILDDAADTKLDEDGNVKPDEQIVIGTAHGMFGKKYYDDARDAVTDGIDGMRDATDDAKIIDSVNRAFGETGDSDKYSLTPGKVADAVIKSTHECSDAIGGKVDDVADKLVESVITSVGEKRDLKPSEKKSIERIVRNEFDKKTRPARDEFETSVAVDTTKATSDITDAALSGDLDEIARIGEIKQALCDSQKVHSDELIDKINGTMNDLCEKIPELIAESLAKRADEMKRRDAEEILRGHLRGFARTIPSFLMAYGDDGFTLATMDSYVDDDVFEELTGITKDMFRFLRDGGSFNFIDKDGKTQTSTLERGVIDPFVFDGACREFLKKKSDNGNPITTDTDDDIFDYVPPQKTNQIFTPKDVVEMQLDLLEKECPGCFDDPDATFADLYVKSGYYLVLIAKRLYKSDVMKSIYPDDGERLHHILKKQIFGIAPSKITSLIAGNYFYGNKDDSDIMDDIRKNLVYADTLSAAVDGTMQQLINEKFDYLAKEGTDVKFDYIVGNPPYQTELKNTSDKPVYNLFMDSAYSIADCVMLITPARFLFNAGKTPKDWNKKMLNDEHLKVVKYIANGRSVFPNTDIKGGIAITLHSMKQVFKPIKVFIVFDELRSIFDKVQDKNETPISTAMYGTSSYRFTDAMHADYPQVEGMLSAGHKYDLASNITSNLLDIVFTKSKDDGKVGIWGRLDNERQLFYIKKEYVTGPDNFNKYKVIIPGANGCGALGETISTPMIGTPMIGYTQTFISIGCFDTENEAKACMKYVKTKFARVLLGILKVTQSNKSNVWRFVPLQDFSESSDINWSLPVPQIDEQLYAKYGLSDEEIDFIESHVKAME